MEKIQTVPVTYNFLRQNAAPMDSKSIFLDLESAKKYAETDPTKYVGQIITVVNTENTENPVQIYKIINNEGKLDDLQKSTIKIWKEAPSFTKFKVKVPANTADARSIKQITPFVNETVTIDWGDNSENTKVTTDSIDIPHNFPNINEEKTYIVKISDNAQRITISNQFPYEEDNKIKIVEAISWGDRVEDVNSCYTFCLLTGNIPEWGANITDASYCYSECLGLKGNIPKWNSTITNAESCYSNCTGLKGNIPEWGANITNAINCYMHCNQLSGNIPEWGANITDASNCYMNCNQLSGNIPAWGANITNAYGCYYNCSGLTGNIPEWGPNITDASYCYSECLGLKGNIPKWNSTITNAESCYSNCPQLTGIWDPNAPIEEVCPERITSHDGCVTDCSDGVKKYFLTTWGGNKQKII